MEFLFKPLVISFLISFVTTPLVINLFKKRGWLDKRKKEDHPKHVHSKPVPRGGGISVFLSILVTSLFFLTSDLHLKAILLAAFLTLLVGVIDDIFDISPYVRLVTNAIAAIIVIGSGIKIDFITNPLGGIVDLNFKIGFINLSNILTFLWILWCMNIVGWSSGVAGQLPGFVAVTSLVIGFLSLRFAQDIAQWPVMVLAGAVAGAYLGFLPFNFYPQKMMPGYSGKSLAGFFLAVLSILSGAKLATVILTLGIPMVDGAWAILRRVYQRKSPFFGDAEHLHHLLLKMNVPQPIIAILYWAFSIILGTIALSLNSKQKLWALIMVVALIAILITGLRRMIKINRPDLER